VTATEVEAVRNRLILAPANSLEKDDAWADLYLAVVGPPPPGSKPPPERVA